MKIIIVWGMPLTTANKAQTTCAIEKFENLKKNINEVYLFSPHILTRLWRKDSSNWLLLALYQPFLLLRLLWESRKIEPDVIHSSSPLVLPSLVICRIMGIPHVVEAHGVMFEEARLYNASYWQIKLMRICEIISYRISSKILANATGTKDRIVKVFGVDPNKIETIPNGANTELFKPVLVDKSCLGLVDNFKYICFVGNLLPWQGIQYLISSAPRVIEKYPNVKFLIIGSGMMEKSLIRMVEEIGLQESFIFTGLVPYQDVPKYINACELCVAPFIKDKDNKMSPLKILEYLACGKPVITSNIRGAGDIITANNCGIAVSSENSEELAEAIIRLLEDEELRSVMGTNGRILIIKDYDWSVIASKIEQIYETLIKPNK